MKKYLLVEVKDGLPQTYEGRNQYIPIDNIGGEFGWFLPSRIIEAERMTAIDVPNGKSVKFHGVRQPEPVDEWEKWIDGCPLPLNDHERQELGVWFARMPGRKG